MKNRFLFLLTVIDCNDFGFSILGILYHKLIPVSAISLSLNSTSN